MIELLANHDTGMVLLSYAVAVIGALVSLYIADYIVDAKGRISAQWLTMAAVVFGGCAIWAMHFTGMLAYRWDVAVTYDIGLTLLSLALPIVFAAIGFFLTYRFRGNAVAWLAAGLFFGLGVAAMHYVGMHAVRLDGHVHHAGMTTVASIVIAVVAATVALKIFVGSSGGLRLASPLVMGLAVCGMHYTGMAGMQVVPDAGGAEINYFDGAWTSGFVGFYAGLAVTIALLAGSAMVIVRRAVDLQEELDGMGA